MDATGASRLAPYQLFAGLGLADDPDELLDLINGGRLTVRPIDLLIRFPSSPTDLPRNHSSKRANQIMSFPRGGDPAQRCLLSRAFSSREVVDAEAPVPRNTGAPSFAACFCA
jgi:hypothetical protein